MNFINPVNPYSKARNVKIGIIQDEPPVGLEGYGRGERYSNNKLSDQNKPYLDIANAEVGTKLK